MAARELSPPLVLVVDDEDYVADLLATAFEMAGYLVQVAYNGREGLERASASAPDLLIIDIMLPYLSGIDLVSELRRLEHLRSVPVIMISAARGHIMQCRGCPSCRSRLTSMKCWRWPTGNSARKGARHDVCCARTAGRIYRCAPSRR